MTMLQLRQTRKPTPNYISFIYIYANISYINYNNSFDFFLLVGCPINCNLLSLYFLCSVNVKHFQLFISSRLLKMPSVSTQFSFLLVINNT